MVKEWVVLIGPPGSGKGTLAQWLAQTHHFAHFSTGWLLKHAVKEQKLRTKLNPVWKSGHLVDDQTMLEILFHYVAKANASRIVFDGFPRNLIQHRLLEVQRQAYQIKKLTIVLLEVDLDLCEERIRDRLCCQKCQRVYHPVFFPPQVPNRCDYDQSHLTTRVDDAKIATRFQVYKTETVPLQQWYQTQNLQTAPFRLKVLNGRYDLPLLQTELATFLNLKNA